MAIRTDLPVLVIGYQRTNTLIQILDLCLSNGTKRIFVSIDAPKNLDDKSLENFELLKSIVEQYRVRFDLFQSKFHARNLGCAVHVLSAIDWAFSFEDELVILEDDCIPSDGFFNFMKEGLAVMDHQSEIALVCGTQHAPSFSNTDRYFKSMYPLTWGWATSKIQWHDIKSGIIDGGKKVPISLTNFNPESIYWLEGSRRAYEGYVDVWDTPLAHFLYSKNKYALLPRENLVSNIGNDSAATHMRDQHDWLFKKVGEFRNGLPTLANSDFTADRWLAKNFYGIRFRHLLTTRITRLKDFFIPASREDLLKRWLISK